MNQEFQIPIPSTHFQFRIKDDKCYVCMFCTYNLLSLNHLYWLENYMRESYDIDSIFWEI